MCPGVSSLFKTSYLKSSSLDLINNIHISHLLVLHLGTLSRVAAVTCVDFFSAYVTVSPMRPCTLLRQAWHCCIPVLSLSWRHLIEDSLANGGLLLMRAGLVIRPAGGCLPSTRPLPMITHTALMARDRAPCLTPYVHRPGDGFWKGSDHPQVNRQYMMGHGSETRCVW